MMEDTQETQKIVFKLFVAGMTVTSMKAIENFKAIYDEYSQIIEEYEIIDIFQQPDRAVIYKIVATPTLMKVSPLPARNLIGDLSDKSKILKVLGLA